MWCALNRSLCDTVSVCFHTRYLSTAESDNFNRLSRARACPEEWAKGYIARLDLTGRVHEKNIGMWHARQKMGGFIYLPRLFKTRELESVSYSGFFLILIFSAVYMHLRKGLYFICSSNSCNTLTWCWMSIVVLILNPRGVCVCCLYSQTLSCRQGSNTED